MTGFTSAIADALDQPDEVLAVDSVKTTVINELRRLDAGIDIRKTDYFNHSQIPDLLVTWSEGSTSAVRPYYLRFDATAPTIADDVRRLNDNSAAFIGLQPHVHDTVGSDLLESLSEFPGVLLADGDAVGGFGELASSHSLARLVPSALVRGGRGIVDTTTADKLSSASVQGFAGAIALDSNATLTAIRMLRPYLTDEYATDVGRLLGMLWIGAGGDLSAFPSEVDISQALGAGQLDTVIRYLLSSSPIDSGPFWERVGSWIKEDHLLELGIIEPSINLQRLMRIKTGDLRFVSAACSFHAAQRLLPLGEPEWAIANRSLRLRTTHVDVDFVRDGRHHNYRAPEHDPVALSVVLDRAEGMALETVELDNGRVEIRVGAKAGDTLTDQDLRANLPVDPSAGVANAVVRLPGAPVGHLRTDFRRRVGTMDGSQQRSMATLGRTAVKLLLPVTAADLEELGGVLTVDPTATGELDLGDDGPGSTGD